MYEEQGRTYLVGIASFGPIRCGNSQVPGVYVRITKWLDWILDNTS